MCGIGSLLRLYQVQLPILSGSTRKPDISHFRVFGCTAYVYIQRDKRKSLQPHMEKCIFVGYPSGYKGWQFYNPVTKKFIISERAIFDERSFPGLSRTSPVDLTPVGAQMNVPDALDSGGDNTFIPVAETAPIEPEFAPQPLHAPSTFLLICSRLLHLLRPQLNQTFPNRSFRTLQMHHSSYSLFRRLQHLYQLQLVPLVLLDLLRHYTAYSSL